MTTSDYLEQLVQDRDDLVDNLTEKGITGLTGDETFTELVPEVLNIPSGGGVDINDYFGKIKSGTSTMPGILYAIKKIPEITFDTESTYGYKYLFYNLQELTEIEKLKSTTGVDDTSYMFANCYKLLTIPSIYMGYVTNAQNMFENCRALKKIPALNFSALTNASNMFANCRAMESMDLRNLDFTNLTNSSNMFGTNSSSGVPDNCLIIVADDTQKTWINTNFARLTNVQTVAEYEAS